MDDNTKVYPVGTKVYLDTFSGVLKGIYLGRDKWNRLMVRVTTKTSNVYQVGEVLESSHLFVFPRDIWRWKSGSYHTKYYLTTSDYVFSFDHATKG